jgi:hypothetical protein
MNEVRIIGDTDDSKYAFDAYPIYSGKKYSCLSAYTRGEAVEKAMAFIKQNKLEREQWNILILKQERGKYDPVTIRTVNGGFITGYTPNPSKEEAARL